MGLEIKREVLAGELRQLGQVALPAVAAVGGIAMPALIYFLINRGDSEALGGWAIPAATDIAFALGVLALFGSRVPLGLKVFLTTVAIIDDLAAILIVAIFYTGKLSTTALVFSAICLVVLFLLNRFGVTNYGAYGLVGVLLWLAVLKSGVHATLAGVLLAFFIPLHLDRDRYSCPARRLEHALHPWAAFFVLPLFAFANAGVDFSGVTAEQAFGGVSLGILLGLTAGKVIGVFGFGSLALLFGLGRPARGLEHAFFPRNRLPVRHRLHDEPVHRIPRLRRAGSALRGRYQDRSLRRLTDFRRPRGIHPVAIPTNGRASQHSARLSETTSR